MIINKVILTGRLTKDPELRKSSNGKFYCSFSIAVQKGYKQGADFFSCIVWEKQAENLCKFQGKGNLILVEGTLQNRSYNDKNGNEQRITDISAQYIEYLGSKTLEDEERYSEPNPYDFVENAPRANKQRDITEQYDISNDDIPF